MSDVYFQYGRSDYISSDSRGYGEPRDPHGRRHQPHPRDPAGAGIAARNKRQEDLRADAARLAANREYQAEIRAVRQELDELRAW